MSTLSSRAGTQKRRRRIPASPGRSTSAMARRRNDAIDLPEGVQTVRASGKVYRYFQRNRGTDQAGPRHTLHGDPYAPVGTPANAQFWRELNRLIAGEIVYPPRSIGDLVNHYRDDDAYLSLSDSSKSSYDVYLNRFQKPEAWGFLAADALTPVAVKAGRDALKDTPGAANHMLAVGRTMFRWAVPLGFASSNPFDAVDDLVTDDSGHVPWPHWARAYVLAHAPEDLQRLVRLGVATCQRESDLVRMGPQHREHVRGRNGIWCRPKKTRRRRKTFFIPLAATDAIELERWHAAPITFKNGRWGHVTTAHRDDAYLYSPTGRLYSPDGLRSRWNRWLDSAAGEILCTRWRAWLVQMVARYEWDIDPDDAKGPTIHGLRGTGLLARFAEGYDKDQIANDVGMSSQMVENYMRFRDQVDVAAAGRDRLKIIKPKG